MRSQRHTQAIPRTWRKGPYIVTMFLETVTKLTAVLNYDEEVPSGEETVFRIAQRQFVDDPHTHHALKIGAISRSLIHASLILWVMVQTLRECLAVWV